MMRINLQQLAGMVLFHKTGILAGAFMLLACSCGGDAVSERVTPDAVIVAFGDSLTRGTGAGEEESYPAVLGRILGHPVINEGVPGEVSAEGLARLPEIIGRYRPSHVVLCHGGNDMLRGWDHAGIKKNLEQMIVMLREAGCHVVLVGVPEPRRFYATARFYRELSEEHDIPYEGEVMADILLNDDLKSDEIHPNTEGYKIMAEAIAGYLR